MKLLIHTDSPTLYSGLSRCGRELVKRFYQKTHEDQNRNPVHDYDISYAAWHYTNMRHSFPFFLYPLQKTAQEEPKQFQAILNDCQPDVIISIGDIWNFHPICQVIRDYKEQHNNAKWVLWLTIDGEHMHPTWQSVLNYADDINVFSRFGEQELFKYAGINANVIYPGVDKDVFKLIDITVKDNNLPFQIGNTFLVVNINQNTDRKNIPVTLEGFRDFAQGKDDVFLLLITNPEDLCGYDLWDFVNSFDIRKKVAITKEAGPVRGMSDAKLNLIYNLASVSINTSIGEGLSLPTLEAMAVGTPVMATDYAAISELLDQGRGIPLKVAGYLYGFNGIKRALVSCEDVAKQLNTLYQDYKTDKKIKTAISEKTRAFTENLSWDNTATALMRRIDFTMQKKKFSFVHEKIKIKELNPLMVIPSWGTHCGIAEYTKSLFDAIRAKNQPVAVFPSYNYNEIPNVVKEGNYNLLHIQHEHSFFKNKETLEQLFVQLKTLRVKIVLTMHTLVSGLMSYNELLFINVDDLIVHCDMFKQRLEERTSENANIIFPKTCNIEVIPMGCGDKHEFDIRRINETKKNLGIMQRYPIVGSFGFLRDQKGFQDFLLSIKLLRSEYPNILGLLVCSTHEFGSKTYDEAFFNFVERQGLENNVMIVREYLEERKLLDTLQCADLFVLNYQDSLIGGGISAAVKTLFRVQRPIIANDSIAFWDLKNEVLKIKTIGPESLVQPIKRVLNDQDIVRALVISANEYVERNSWNNVAQKHIDLYYR